MEAQQQQSQNEENGKGGGGGAVGSSYHISSGSRQSSTRWTPTTDQIRILKELYYNNGIRSPSAEQIQRISARLRQYGKIEGKNVFYWFQNHKARERQKKRFTSDHTNMQRGSSAAPTNNTHNNNNAANNWKPDQETIHNKYTNIPTGVCASSSAGMVTMGQVGNYGYGSVPMEKSFRDCTISAGGSSGHVGAINHNLGWVGVDPYSSTYTTFFDKIIPNNAEEEEEDDNDNDNDDDDDNDNDDDAPEIETLPLFPMHGEDIHGYCSNLKSNTHNYDGSAGWYHHHHHHHHQIDDNSYGFKNGSRASLELSLNSYSRKSPDFA